jgi:hypothetical protein
MDWTQYKDIAQAAAAVVTILMAVAIGPLFKLLHKIKTNDLHHLDLKIDANHKALSEKLDTNLTVISKKVDEISDQVEKVSDKLDSHLQWHLNQPK